MTYQPKKVAIVLAWYNRADYIADTIQCLLDQDFNNFEIILVNDGSPDPEVKNILDSYNDPRLKIIHQKNTGFVTAIRRAIDESDSEYIAIHGAGDVSYRSRIRLQYSFLEQNREYCAVGCNTTYRIMGESYGDCHDNPTKPPIVKSNMVKYRNVISGGEAMVRRKDYQTVGGFRTFFYFSQDKDLWLRLLDSRKMAIIPEFVYERRIFLKDGLAVNYKKTLQQLAYSSIAEKCHTERSKGKIDSVDSFGNLAFINTPRGVRTSLRLLSGLNRINKANPVSFSDLKEVKRLWGTKNYFLVILFWKYLKLSK